MQIKYFEKNIRKIYLVARDIYTYLPRNFLKGYSFPPLSLVILLTYRCNCRCKHCFYYNEINKKDTERKIDDELSKQELTELINDAKKIGVKNITFHGGEPLLRKELIDLIKLANKLKIRTNITTNAALINEKKASEIVRSGLNNMCVSIDGPEKIHDLIRGKGTFVKAIKAIKMINKYKEKYNTKKPAISIACTITSMNINYLDDIMNLFKDIKINHIQFTGLTWNSKRNLDITKKILKDFKTSIVEVGSEIMPDELSDIDGKLLIRKKEEIIKIGKKYDITVFFPPFEKESDVKDFYTNDTYSFTNKCTYPWASSVVSPKGYVYACIPMSFLNKNFGNIRKKSLKSIWNSKDYKKFRILMSKSKKIPICNKCCELDPSNRIV